jgi:hypothetical protein
MLEWNRAKVKNLTGLEIWLMIVGRVLVGFGFGVLAVRYLPEIANPLGVPAMLVGLVLVLIAAKGLFRSTQENPD